MSDAKPLPEVTQKEKAEIASKLIIEDMNLARRLSDLSIQLNEAHKERDLYETKLKALVLVMASMDEENGVLRERCEWYKRYKAVVINSVK